MKALAIASIFLSSGCAAMLQGMGQGILASQGRQTNCSTYYSGNQAYTNCSGYQQRQVYCSTYYVGNQAYTSCQ
jgi:hypothetical protein